MLYSVFSGEYDRTSSGAGRCGNTGGNGFCFLKSGRIERRVKQHVEGLGVDLHEGFFFGDHAFVDEVAGDLNSGSGGTLTVTGLEHVELLIFDRELHILHVAVVCLEGVAHAEELLVHFRKDFLHLGDRHRSTHAGDNVFALCVHKELAHQALLTCSGVTREGNARTGSIAHVTESHHLNFDRGTPGIRDVMVHTVDVSAGIVPAAEHGLDSLEQLDLRIVREIFAQLILILSLELICQLLEIVSRQLDVELDAFLLLNLVDELLEVFLADFHDDIREHLDEASVAVPGPSGVPGFRCDNAYDLLVETEVEDRVHHAGHGCAGAGAYGYEQRIFEVAEFFTGGLFHDGDVFHDLLHDLRIDGTAVFVIFGAGFGGDGEALRYRQTDAGHFGEVSALAAQQISHAGIAFFELINVFCCHY